MWDGADQAGVDLVATTDIVVSDAPMAVVDAIREIADRLEADWAGAVTETGYDGAAALEAMRDATGL